MKLNEFLSDLLNVIHFHSMFREMSPNVIEIRFRVKTMKIQYIENAVSPLHELLQAKQSARHRNRAGVTLTQI